MATAGSVSFTIGTAGYYLLTVGLNVPSMDATTQYPIALGFKFGDKVCPSDQYFDKRAVAVLYVQTMLTLRTQPLFQEYATAIKDIFGTKEHQHVRYVQELVQLSPVMTIK